MDISITIIDISITIIDISITIMDISITTSSLIIVSPDTVNSIQHRQVQLRSFPAERNACAEFPHLGYSLFQQLSESEKHNAHHIYRTWLCLAYL
jgi:hypothetical protein